MISGADILIDGDTFEKHGGEITIINSQSIHQSHMIDGSADYMGFALQINYSFVKKCFPEIDNYYFKHPNQKEEKN